MVAHLTADMCADRSHGLFTVTVTRPVHEKIPLTNPLQPGMRHFRPVYPRDTDVCLGSECHLLIDFDGENTNLSRTRQLNSAPRSELPTDNSRSTPPDAVNSSLISLYGRGPLLYRSPRGDVCSSSLGDEELMWQNSSGRRV